MIDYLESREMMSGSAVNPTTSAQDLGVIQLNEASGVWEASRFNGDDFVSETVATWNTVPADTVVVHGDLWGTGQDELIRFDKATGTFRAEWKSGTGIGAGTVTTWVPNMDLQFLTVQDLNHDGRADIMAQDRNTGKWAVSTSKPGGGYEARFAGTWQTDVDWQHVSFVDFNGDGMDDVLAYDPVANSWNGLLGKAGSFTPLTFSNPSPSSSLQQVTFGNFDTNPGIDLLERNLATGAWTKTSSANGVVTTQTVGNWSQNATWMDITTLNFWGNGRDVILGRNSTTNEWRVLWAAGSGYASASLGVWQSGQYVDPQVGDFNGDGREDFASRQVATGKWFVLAASSSTVDTTLFGTWEGNTSYGSIQAGDFNSDGKTDIVGLETGSGLWRGLITTASSAVVTTTLSNPEFSYLATDIMTGDFDADGRFDVLSRDANTGNRQLIEFDGVQLVASRFNTWTAYANTWSNQYVIDLNGGGDNDLLGRDATTGDWWLTTLTATEPTTSKVANWSPSVNWQSWQTTDFDGNGTKDVLARNPATGDWTLLRSVNGVFSSSVIASWSTSVTWTDFQVADLFGNGRPVLMARNAATNLWQGLWSSGSGFATSGLRGLASGRTYIDTRVVDFFGDGRQTVVTRDAQSGVWYGIWYGNNQFRLTNLGTWNPAGTWEGVVAADLEGDGKQALYGHDAVSGEWRRIGFDGTTTTNVVVVQTVANFSLKLSSVGNFVDAARDSILTQNPVTGNWYRLSKTGTKFQFDLLGIWSETASWTSTTVGDYNHDGRADVFGYSSAQSTWGGRTFDGSNWQNVTASNLGPNAIVTDVPGASDATLRAVILADLPGLAPALAAGDTRTAVRLLREWAANAGDSALFSNPLLAEANGPADAYWRAYVPNSGGSSCGGFGEFYTQILKLFQIDSLSVNLGDFQADLIHTTVVVPIWENNAWSFEVYDPTFNCTLIKSVTGKAVSYLDIVAAVQAGDTSMYGVEQASNAGRDFLSAVPVDQPQLTLEQVKNGTYVYSWDDYGLDDYLDTYKDNFRNYGYSAGLTGFFELMPQVISVYANNGSGDPNVSANMRISFLTELARLGVTVPP